MNSNESLKNTPTAQWDEPSKDVYLTPQGERIALTRHEYVTHPHNSRLQRIEDETQRRRFDTLERELAMGERETQEEHLAPDSE